MSNEAGAFTIIDSSRRNKALAIREQDSQSQDEQGTTTCQS